MRQMTHAFVLAARHLLHHRARTAMIVAALLLTILLPAALRLLVDRAAHALLARADATPLLLGARGSELDLVVASLYFARPTPRSFGAAALERAARPGTLALPLHLGLSLRDRPIVGTDVGYFEARGLAFAEGRPFAILGECVLGARAAEAFAREGGPLVTDARDPYDLAGTIPLRLAIAGTLAPSGTPDDDAIFVDVKTAWTIEGLGHGHRDAAAIEDPTDLLGRVGEHVVASEALRHYEEITERTIEGFHFHGDPGTFPIHAAIVMPEDAKAATLLRGAFQRSDEPLQLVRPREALERLLREILRARRVVEIALLVAGATTLAVVGVVIALSVRLRREELATFVRMGAARGTVARIVVAEILLVALLAVGGAALGAALLRTVDAPLERILLGR